MKEVGINVSYQVDEDNVLEIVVSLGEDHGPSKSGKTQIIASTQGNITIAPNTMLGLNVYRKPEPEKKPGI